MMSGFNADAVKRYKEIKELEKEMIKDAAEMIEGELGKTMADKFRAAKTPQERGPILQEVAYKQNVGEDIYDGTASMNDEMRSSLFESWVTIQNAGVDDGGKFSENLQKSLSVKRDTGPNEDGTPGVPRTRLQVPLDVLELELKLAKTPEEKERVKNKITRELVIAAKEEGGEKVDENADVVLVNDVDGTTVRINADGEKVTEKKT
jgi:hypothetical protein